MSFLQNTDINKRARNLFVGFDASPPPPDQYQLTSASGAMAFFAQYQSDFPAVVGLGGDWGTTASFVGPNATVAGPLAEFSGESTVWGPAFPVSPFVTPFVWEVTPLTPPHPTGAIGAQMGVTCSVADFACGFPLVNSNAIYETNGTITGFLSTVAATPYTTGDVIGVVVSYDGVETYSASFYRNGVLQATIPVLFNAGPIDCRAMVSRGTPAPAVDHFAAQLNANLVDLVFSAQYLADFPTAVALGGSLNAGTVGVNGTFQTARVVSFTGASAILGSAGGSAVATPVMYEWEVLALDAGVIGSLGFWINPAAGYNANAFDGGGGLFDTAAYYTDGNTSQGNTFTPLAIGDVLGIVVDNGTGGAPTWYVNGVMVGTESGNFTDFLAVASMQ